MRPIEHNHKKTSVFPAVAVALIMAWATESLQGQMQAGRGRGLDANRLVGSSGRNPNSSRYSSLGNQTISGNVGAGRSFKGIGGVGDPRTFQGSLGSRGSLSGFRRDSYGLGDNAGSLGVAQPFYLPSGTVLGVRGITSGRNRPGSSMPGSVNLSPPPQTGPAVSRPLTGLPSRLAALTPADLRTDLRTSPAGQAGVPAPIVETASNLFGIQRMSPGLGATARSMYAPNTRSGIWPGAVPGQAAREEPGKSFQALPPWARPSDGSDSESETGQQPYLPPSMDQERIDKNLEEARALIDQSTGGPDMPSIVDVYEQMMAEENSKEQIDPNAIQTPDETISPLVPSAKKDREAAVRDLTAKMLTYNSFVGNQASSFNDLMAQAESLLKNRQYYYAARTYKRASELRPENPLAYLGRSYSLTGAGDLISASKDLAKALELFPDQAKRKIDLQGFFHSPEELTRITTKLEAMADARTDNVRIRLLLGYIYHYSGQNEAAIRVLNEAAESAKSDEKTPAELTKTIEKFAQAVAKQAEETTSQ